MKKYLFWLLIFWLWLINYSFANITLVWTDYWYSPIGYVLNEDYTFSLNDIVSYIDEDNCAFTISEDWIYSSSCEFALFSDVSENYISSDNCTFYSWSILYFWRSDWSSCESLELSWNFINPWSSCDWLIDPNSCPVCESTFSTLFVNWTQITWSSNVYITTPDYFDYETSYYTGYMDLNIQNVGDPEYIENQLAIQTYRPTSDEFAVSFVWGLTLLMPYILLTLFVLFIWRIIRRIFK